MTSGTRWGRDFDADELARLETRMWKAYYRRQPARLFVLLVQAVRVQAGLSWPRAMWVSVLLTRAAAGFARSTGDYERFAPDIGRAYRSMKLPDAVDVEAVARHELRWWVVRREIGLAAGAAAGESITDLYAALYDVPRDRVADAGRLRGLAAEIRDRGATDDPDGPRGAGTAYWPEVARLLRDSYRSLRRALDDTPGASAADGRDPAAEILDRGATDGRDPAAAEPTLPGAPSASPAWASTVRRETQGTGGRVTTRRRSGTSPG